ncbi:MAG: hypothetical protein AB4038_14410 [Prochloraceae cyanobacterium]
MLSPQDDNSSLNSIDNQFQLSPPPDKLQVSLLQIRDYYAALAEKYSLIAEEAKAKLAHAEGLLKSWEAGASNSLVSSLSHGDISSSEKAEADINLDLNSLASISTDTNGTVANVDEPSSGQTLTTAEVASKLDRTVEWCNNQRYQHPELFTQISHYFKDENGFIHWTSLGVQQLLKLAKSGVKVPSDVIPTKQVSESLEVSTKWISRTRIKFASLFREGTHYYHNSKQGYLWTASGIEQLRQIQANNFPPDSSSKTKKSSKPKSTGKQKNLEMLSPYRKLSQTAAVEKLLKDNAGSILTLDYVVEMLYGKLKPEVLQLAKNRVVKILSVGKQRGKWSGVPNETGCYTWDWKMIQAKTKQKDT